MAGIEIRRMVQTDVDRVVSIEKELFSLPWSRASFLYEIGDRQRSYAIVAAQEGVVIGYAIGWFVADELHIGNIAVTRDEQGKGYGKALLEHLLEEANRRGVRIITLEVRVSNARAINLYRLYGFKGVALRKSYYVDNGEDALVMILEIDPGTGAQIER